MKNSNFNDIPTNIEAGSRNAFYLGKKEKLNPSIFYFDPKKMEYTLNKNKTKQAPNDIHFVPANVLYSGSLSRNALSAINKSYAIKLAETVLNAKGINMLSKSSSTPGTENDNEILQIYLKQIILILRSTNIFYNKKDPAIHKFSLFSTIDLYMQLLNSFWNKVEWKNLFPSMPKVADILQSNRKVLVQLMLEKKNKFRIDQICNTYCNFIGAAQQDNLFFISFMDFYFFTWLSHFGIINYLHGNDMDPVEIGITGYGRNILSYLAIE
jgi:hypothetical protein